MANLRAYLEQFLWPVKGVFRDGFMARLELFYGLLKVVWGCFYGLLRDHLGLFCEHIICHIWP